jgi:hypothetical protein
MFSTDPKNPFVLSAVSLAAGEGWRSSPNCHREERSDVAIPWRTGFRSQRDCFITL